MGTVNSILTDSRKSDINTLKKSLRAIDDTLLFTKFMIPSPSSNCICRLDLISRLEEIINKKLTLISAPAGYGKTTLISMWLSHKGTSIRTAWVSLDEKDNNMQIFWRYILMAIEKSVSGSVDNYESVDCSIMEYSMDILLNGLMNRLSNINDDIVLVLDDYHVVYEAAIHDSLQYFISHLPPNIHVVISSRNISPIKLARLRSHGDLLELKTEDLRFTHSEISEFLSGTMKLCLEENDVRKLEQLTEGWIVALTLAALTINNYSDVRVNLNDFSHINDYMVDYMSEEVFGVLNKDVKDFLLKTSILDTLNINLCNAVAGISNSLEIINILEKNNIFTTALDDKKSNYRYHSIFAGFLKSKLLEVYPDVVEELYIKASRCYEDNNMVKEAIDYSGRINSYQNTIRLIEKYGEIMIINRDTIMLAETIESLPKQIIENNAKIYMLYTLAVAGKNNSNDSGIYVGKEYVSFENEIFQEYKSELFIIRMTLAYSNEDFITAIDYGDKVLENLPEGSPVKCLPYKILTQIYCAAGDSPKAESCLDLYIEAIRNRNYFNDFFVDITYIHMVAHILCGAGKYRNALEILVEFEKKFNTDNTVLPAITNSIYLNLGYLYYELGELELSHSSIEKCIELSTIKMDTLRLISCYILIARINCSIGNYASMMLFIKKAEDLCDRYNLKFMIICLIIYMVRILLVAGEVEYADYLISKYDIRVQESFDISYEYAHLALADLYIAKGEFAEAQGLLDRLYGEISGTERNFNYVRVMILKSLLFKYSKNEPEALKCMNEALEKASEQGYISTFSEFGAPVAEIICMLINNTEEIGFRTRKNVDYAYNIISYIKEPEGLMDSVDPELLRSLSRRETEVFNYILSGYTNKEIAARLFVAECTIKKHINNIYGKIGILNRTQVLHSHRKFVQP